MAAALAVGAMILAFCPRGQAASFTCNSRRDAPDANPGDGVCASATGFCTLRAAVEEANSLPGPDSVTLPAGNYRLAAGEIAITDDLNIAGAGAQSGNGTAGTAVSATYHRGRVFSVSSQASVVIAGMRIQHGTAAVGQNGGGILNNGTLQLNDLALKNNVADVGGGLYNNGTASLINVTIHSNIARTYLGGGM